MSSLRNFKDAADEIMKDITVSSELKDETLTKCVKRRNGRFLKTKMFMALCAGIILIVAFKLGLNFKIQSPDNQMGDSSTQNANIMVSPENSTIPVSPGDKQGTVTSTIETANIKNIDEAKKYLEVDVLEPYYLPKGFELKGIFGSRDNDSKKRSAWIEYTSEDKTFVLSVEQGSNWNNFEDHRDVNINGVVGHIKYFKDDLGETSELRWFVGKNLYTIVGAVSEDDALKVAESLK